MTRYKENKENILKKTKIGTPEELGISIEDYSKGVLKIINEQNKKNPMLITPSEEELKKKYKNSIVILDNGEIIANSTIEPKVFKELEKFKTAVIGTLIVKNDEKYRGKGLGSLLLIESHKKASKENDIVLSATFNKIVQSKREKLGYKKLNGTDIGIPFEYMKEAQEAFTKIGKDSDLKEKTKFNDALTFYEELISLMWINNKIGLEELQEIIKILREEKIKLNEEILKLKK